MVRKSGGDGALGIGGAEDRDYGNSHGAGDGPGISAGNSFGTARGTNGAAEGGYQGGDAGGAADVNGLPRRVAHRDPRKVRLSAGHDDFIEALDRPLS